MTVIHRVKVATLSEAHVMSSQDREKEIESWTFIVKRTYREHTK